MSRYLTKRMIIVGILTLSPGAWAQSANPTDKAVTEDNTARVRALYRKAQAAFAKENYEESRKLLLEAWTIQPASDVALALGQTELELKQYRDCAEHLDYAIRNFSAVGSEKVLEAAKQALAGAKVYVGQVNIVTNRDGADIRIDGKTVGKSPLPIPVYVQPGQHDIEVRFASDAATEKFEVGAGKTYNSNLIVQANNPTIGTGQTMATNAPSVPPTTPIAPASEQGSQRSIVPAVIGGSVLALGLVGAIAFRLKSDSEYSDANALLAKLGAGACKNTGVTSPDCTTLHDSNQRGDNYRNWSTVGIVTAIAAFAGTSAYLLWPSPKSGNPSAGRAAWSIVPTASAEHKGLLVSGEF
jgi:tetratricopeptide (TPR) repeat protein